MRRHVLLVYFLVFNSSYYADYQNRTGAGYKSGYQQKLSCAAGVQYLSSYESGKYSSYSSHYRIKRLALYCLSFIHYLIYKTYHRRQKYSEGRRLKHS